jgi:hypothetical protein
LVVFSATAALAWPAYAQSLSHKLGDPLYRQMLYLSHTVTNTGSLTNEAISGYVAPVASGGALISQGGATFGGAYGAQTAVTRFVEAGLPRMPVAISGAQPAQGYSQDFVMSSARSWVQNNASAFTVSLGAWMTQRGLSSGQYSYTQDLMVSTADGPKRRSLYWTVMSDGKGRALYGNPMLTNEDPIYLEATYINLNVADGLPSTWKFENAGTLAYRLLDKHFEPLTNFTTVNVNGAFDQESDGEDPESGVRCLMDERNPGCTWAGVSIRSLLAANGAAAAMVDYIHALEPKYVAASNCTLDGVNEVECERADAGFRYDERVWSCSGLRNKGVYGFRVVLRASRYLAAPAEPLTQYYKLSELAREGISPTESFEKTVPRAALGGRHPDTVLISPMPGDSSLIARNDATFMQMVTGVGVLSVQPSSGGFTFGPSHADLYVQQISQEEQALVTGNAPTPNGQLISPEKWVTFYVNNPAEVEKLELSSLTHWGPIEISLNGQIVYVGPTTLAQTSLRMGGFFISNYIFKGFQVWPNSCTSITGAATWCGTSQYLGDGYECGIGGGDNGYECWRVPIYTNSPWSYFGGGCTNQRPDDFGYGGGVLCQTAGAQLVYPAAYNRSYSASPAIDLRSRLVRGVNTLRIKTAALSGWGYTIRLRSSSCEDQNAGYAPPAPLPYPRPAVLPPPGGYDSGW